MSGTNIRPGSADRDEDVAAYIWRFACGHATTGANECADACPRCGERDLVSKTLVQHPYGESPAASTLSLMEARRLGREWLATDGGVPRVFVPILAALTATEPPTYPGLRLDEYAAQAQAWLDSHLPHDMTEKECVPCQMATNLILVCNAWFEAEGWLADEKGAESRG